MHQKKEFLIDALHIFILVSLAFAQPLYVLSRNAEFFVAHNSKPADIILFIIGLCFILPMVLVLVEVIAGLPGRNLRKGAHYFIVAFLTAVIALTVLKKTADFSGTLLLTGAIFSGILVTLGYMRFKEVRHFLTILFPAIFIFPYLFLFDSPVNKIVFPEETPSLVAIEVKNPVPIVMVVFDEFPVTSLMDENHQIDPVRYPNFASLASDSYWFRNATTVSDLTHFAVPAILNGNYPVLNKLPTISDYPNNLFTLLNGLYNLEVFEPFTQLCPTQSNRRKMTQDTLTKRMSSMLKDLTLVYLHVVLPSDLTAGLPIVTQTWKNFTSDKVDKFVQGMLNLMKADNIHIKRNRGEEFSQFVSSIYSTNKPTLYFQHIFLPHIPWQFFPSGKQYGVNIRIDGLEIEQEKWVDNEWLVNQSFQRHLLQVGFVDKLLGELISRLKDIGLYERSLIIITADHGVSFQAKESRRYLSKANYQDILPIPLFIKTPNQRNGIISDRNVETIDILPTIGDVLGITMPWSVDGHSVFDESLPDRAEKVIFAKYRASERYVFEPNIDAKYETLDRKLALFGSGAKSDGLFKIGPHNELIGRYVSEIELAGEAGVTINLEQSTLFSDLDVTYDFLPSIIRGRVVPLQNTAVPLNLAIAINGIIRAETLSYKGEKNNLKFTALVPENSFRIGKNVVEVFVVSEIDGSKRLKKTRNKSIVTYMLSVSDKHGEIITSSEEKTYRVVRGALRGGVGRVYGSGEILGFRGWTADVKNLELPEAIIVFVNGKFFYEGHTGVQRPDIPQAFGSTELLEAGFEFVLPLPLLDDISNTEIRLFALSKRGVASELGYPKEYKWGKK